ncbi:hypothetical protein FJ945_30010 [Mesorhizobium sp. B2-4-9]|uniref:hypothetical protein n=1 Tax=Mesorhizobium sp. B2-4-9 TaxID=2589940 RepID=UPI00112A78DC|nr:hypothetical protein [Mesorhizobium sp. B2-4-9]TPL14851.1 hypothetical protein FJ945_30010 [Mesorhizobium sp. B2-4-9]
MAITLSRSSHDDLSLGEIKEVERLEGLAKRLIDAIESRVAEFKRLVATRKGEGSDSSAY